MMSARHFNSDHSALRIPVFESCQPGNLLTRLLEFQIPIFEQRAVDVPHQTPVWCFASALSPCRLKDRRRDQGQKDVDVGQQACRTARSASATEQASMGATQGHDLRTIQGQNFARSQENNVGSRVSRNQEAVCAQAPVMECVQVQLKASCRL